MLKYECKHECSASTYRSGIFFIEIEYRDDLGMSELQLGPKSRKK
jgi:hypothetical protein